MKGFRNLNPTEEIRKMIVEEDYRLDSLPSAHMFKGLQSFTFYKGFGVLSKIM